MSVAPPPRRRIAPIPVAQLPVTYSSSLQASPAAQSPLGVPVTTTLPSHAEPAKGSLPPWRRISVDILHEPFVNYKELVKQAKRSIKQQDGTKEATPPPDQAGPHGMLPSPRSAHKHGGLLDVIQRLEQRCLDGQLGSDDDLIDDSSDEGEEYDSEQEEVDADDADVGSGSSEGAAAGGSDDEDEGCEAEDDGGNSGSGSGGSSSDDDDNDTDVGQAGDGQQQPSGSDPAAKPGGTTAGAGGGGGGEADNMDGTDKQGPPAKARAKPRKSTKPAYDPDFIDDSDIAAVNKGSVKTVQQGFFINKGGHGLVVASHPITCWPQGSIQLQAGPSAATAHTAGGGGTAPSGRKQGSGTAIATNGNAGQPQPAAESAAAGQAGRAGVKRSRAAASNTEADVQPAPTTTVAGDTAQTSQPRKKKAKVAPAPITTPAGPAAAAAAAAAPGVIAPAATTTMVSKVSGLAKKAVQAAMAAIKKPSSPTTGQPAGATVLQPAAQQLTTATTPTATAARDTSKPTTSAAAAVEDSSMQQQGTPEPAVKRRSRALAGLSDAKARLIKKLSTALTGEGGSQPSQLKLSALKLQLLNFAQCCYRESGGSADWVSEVAQPAVSEVVADGREAAIAGPATDKAGLLLREVQKLLEDSLSSYEDLRTDVVSQIAAWAGLDKLPDGSQPPLPAPLLATVEKLVDLAKRLCTDEQGFDRVSYLTQIASWDSSKSLGAAALEAQLDAAARASKAKTNTSNEAAVGQAAVTAAEGKAGRAAKKARTTDMVETAQVSGSPTILMDTAIKSQHHDVQAAAPAAVAASAPVTSVDSAGGGGGSKQSTQPTGSTFVCDMSSSEEAAALARALTVVRQHAGDSELLRQHHAQLSGSNKNKPMDILSRAVLLGLALQGPTGGTCNDLEGILTDNSVVNKFVWSANETKTSHPILRALARKPFEAIAIVIEKKRNQRVYAWSGYPGLTPLAKPQRVKSEGEDQELSQQPQ